MVRAKGKRRAQTQRIVTCCNKSIYSCFVAHTSSMICGTIHASESKTTLSKDSLFMSFDFFFLSLLLSFEACFASFLFFLPLPLAGGGSAVGSMAVGSIPKSCSSCSFFLSFEDCFVTFFDPWAEMRALPSQNGRARDCMHKMDWPN